jgi:CRISPR-associated protein Cas1
MFDGISEIHKDEWFFRNEHWISELNNAATPRRRRERPKDPLILCGHGVSLRVDGGTLLIRNGLTHYPQEREKFRFFKGDPAIPPRIIMLDGSGCVSFDVLDWLSEQRVPLVRINWQGEVVSVIGGPGFAADQAKVRWQIETRADPARRMEFATQLIAEKIAGSIETLETVVPLSRSREVAIARLRRDADGLKTRPPVSIGALLGIEGNAAVAYFKAWEGLGLRWKGATRRPIPDTWRKIGPRSALRAGKPSNERAVHPVNAILNYAYAILQSEVQIDVVARGYDPRLGVMHNPGRREEPALVFDFMEPRRPKVDVAVLAFALRETFSPADFVIRSDGTVRLAPQLARRVCQLAATLMPSRR